MNILNKWQNPGAVLAVSVMLAAAVFALFSVASDMNKAADGSLQVVALTEAAAGVDRAWSEAVGASALAATGQAPVQAQAAYDSAVDLYNSSRAVLTAVGIERVDAALAGSDRGFIALASAFDGTLNLASAGDVSAAVANHTGNVTAIYEEVRPAVVGLGQIAGASQDRLYSRMNSGAGNLRLFGWASLAVVALAAAFITWSVRDINRRESDDRDNVRLQPVSLDRAA